MKFRDPETGEFKELYTKAADTLPVGTVVDFDGTEIPAGWEKTEEVINVTEAGTNLNDYKETGIYFFRDANTTPANIPTGINGWLVVLKGEANVIKQIWYRWGTANSNDFQTFVRTYSMGSWSTWQRFMVENDFYYKDGDKYTTPKGAIFIGGLITSSGGKIATTIFTNKSLAKIKSATLDNFNIAVRKDNGGYLVNTTKADFVANGGETKVTLSSDNAICLEFFSNNYTSPVNNTPVGIEISNLQITFNE